MRVRRLTSLVLWLFAVALVAGALSRVAVVARDQLAAPFDLISEGPHMSTIKAIRAGTNIYDPASFLDLPLIMSPYTPLYHVLVASLPARSGNPFFTGRLVALLFMLGAVASLFAVARGVEPAARGADVATGRLALAPVALIALALFFLIRPVVGNTAYLRCDSTALFLSVWAVVVAAGAGAARRRVIASAVLCVAAIAAKQSLVAAGGACFVYFLLLRRDWRSTATFVLAALASGAALAVAAWLTWGNGFWLATTIPMTDYPRDWESCWQHWQMMTAQPVFLLIVGLAVGVLLMVVATAPAALLATPYFIYMLLAWVTAAWVMTGMGAENHNLIEPLLATLLWMVSTIARRDIAPRPAWIGVALAGLVLALVSVVAVRELSGAKREDYSYTTPLKTERYVRNRDTIAAALRTLGIEHGRMMNLKNSQVTHDFDGQMNLNDPWMYVTVLFQSRPVTAARVVQAIEARYFDAILVAPGVVSAAGQTADNPTQHIIRTIFRYYMLRVRGAEVNVLTPIGGRGS